MINELTLQLAWNRLLAIVEEQAQVLLRTAFSTVVREAGDLSAGVFNCQGQMLAQAVTGTPGHVNSMADAVVKFLNVYPLASLKPGDVLVTNDPWDGTGHLNDFTVVTPVFKDDVCVGLFASTSHIADVGGRGFGADANDVFEEGICIPISYLFEGGVLNKVLMQLIKANVRDANVAEGDLYSLTACNQAGADALLQMLDEFELDDLAYVGEEIIQRSHSAMLDVLATLPHKTTSYEMRVDGYDEPIDLRATLTINAKQIGIDFAGTTTASSKGINVPLPYTQAYASFGVRCVVGNTIPNNAGSLSVVDVVAPQGCILNAQRPRAVSARHSIGQMLPDVVLGCLQQLLPGEVPAEGASCIWNPVFMSAVGAANNDSNRGRHFVINPIFNGGTGARPSKDGLSTTAFPSGVKTTSTEINEATSQLLVLEKEYTPNSGGVGCYRGGLGQTIRIRHRWGEDFVVSKMFDRVQHPPRGRDGGGDGATGAVYLEDKEGKQLPLPAKGRDLVPCGHDLVLQTPGGGGLGAPTTRNVTLLKLDKDEGYTA